MMALLRKVAKKNRWTYQYEVKLVANLTAKSTEPWIGDEQTVILPCKCIILNTVGHVIRFGRFVWFDAHMWRSSMAALICNEGE